MNEALYPAQIEEAIRSVTNRLAKSPQIITDREAEMLKAKRKLDLEKDKAFRAATGTQKDREAEAEIQTAALREEYDTAYIAYRYADRTARALEKEQSRLQTSAKLVLAMYGAAGVGER